MTPQNNLPMTETPTADNVHRGVKIALDSGEAKSIGEAYELFRSYRLGLLVGPEITESPAHQAALLTAVNIGARAMLGGVTVAGNIDAPLLVNVPGATTVADAVTSLGAQIIADLPEGVPTLLIGTVDSKVPLPPCTLRVVFRDWRGGVVPLDDQTQVETGDAITPAAILAAAIGVGEVFQHLRGNPIAGRRTVGMSLWVPGHADWETAPEGPLEILLPAKLWLIGLGHLGQAYLWVLGLLPYEHPEKVMLFLQDYDRLAKSNESTSLLTNSSLIGQLKTRTMAHWAESRGFKTRLVERRYAGGIQVAEDEPRVALGGVDNPEARAAYEDAGFDWIIEAGLGTGPVEYNAIRLHTFPASTTAQSKWGGALTDSKTKTRNNPAYDQLSADGMEECGLIQLASRSVGVPFVGTVAATLAIAEVLRQLNGGPTSEVIDMTLRDLSLREVVPASKDVTHLNPGYTK